MFRRNPGPSINDIETRLLVATRMHTNENVTLDGRILDCIIQKIDDGLTKNQAIGGNNQITVSFHVYLPPPKLREWKPPPRQRKGEKCQRDEAVRDWHPHEKEPASFQRGALDGLLLPACFQSHLGIPRDPWVPEERPHRHSGWRSGECAIHAKRRQ